MRDLAGQRTWHWTRTQVTLSFLEALLPRGDWQIGRQELREPILAKGTWPHVFRTVLWSAWIDNQGVLHSLLKGSGLGQEANNLIGDMWMELELLEVALWAGRVESKANIADGPTRYDLSGVLSLGATWAAPCWPVWAKVRY